MNCKQCNTLISSYKRLDTIYCDHNCQQAYFKRKDKIKRRIKKLKKDIEFNKKWIVEENIKLEKLNKSNNFDVVVYFSSFF